MVLHLFLTYETWFLLPKSCLKELKEREGERKRERYCIGFFFGFFWFEGFGSSNITKPGSAIIEMRKRV